MSATSREAAPRSSDSAGWRSLPWLLIFVLAIPAELVCLPPLRAAAECRDLDTLAPDRGVALAILLIAGWWSGRGPIRSLGEAVVVVIALVAAFVSLFRMAFFGVLILLDESVSLASCVFELDKSCMGWAERGTELAWEDKSFYPRVQILISGLFFNAPFAVYGCAGLALCLRLIQRAWRTMDELDPARPIHLGAGVVLLMALAPVAVLFPLGLGMAPIFREPVPLLWIIPLAAMGIALRSVLPALGAHSPGRRALSAVFLATGVLAPLFSQYAVFPWDLVDAVLSLLGFVDIDVRSPRSLGMGLCFALLLTLGALLADDRRRLSLPLGALVALSWPLAAMAFASLEIDHRPPSWVWEPLEWAQYALPDPVIHALVAAFFGSGLLLSLSAALPARDAPPNSARARPESSSPPR